MYKDAYNTENKIDNIITISLIKSSLNSVLENKSKGKEVENHFNIPISDVNHLIDFIQTIENLFSNMYRKKPYTYNLFKRYFKYMNKLILSPKNIKFDNLEIILSFFIPLLKNYINTKKHHEIQELFLLIIKYTNEKIFPSNAFRIIIEVLIQILILILNSNQEYKYCVKDEPFILIDDIIETLITYQKMHKNDDDKNSNNNDNGILSDVIDIFDKYLITPYYTNICFKDSSIWLKLLENYVFKPAEESDIDSNRNNNSNNDIININNTNNIQKKLFLFLIKIYKFSMHDEYFQEIIIQKGIINLKYYINALNYLMSLFQEEEKAQSESDFKIINGFYLQRDNYLFLPNIKLKSGEFSIIFSFKIDQIPPEAENITILNIYQKQAKSILNLSIDENNYLYILYNGDKKWNTYIKIKRNKFYLVCFYPVKKLMSYYKFSLYINETINENVIKDDQMKGYEIPEADSCYYYKKKKISLDMPKDLSIELGKNNFVGVIGEFFIINKIIPKGNIHHLFNLKENYSKIISQTYNNYENLYKYNSPNFTKSRFGTNKLSEKEKKSIEFFKQLSYNIVLEIMTYKINKFSKTKFFSRSTQEAYLNSNSNSKDNNDVNLSIVSIMTVKSESSSMNNYSCISSDTSNSPSNYNVSCLYQNDLYKQQNINIDINLFKMKFSSIVFYQNKGIDFLTFQLHNILSTIDDKELLDAYLYETISFMYKFMLITNQNIIDVSVRQSPKLDNKISIFFLTLLTLLFKKEKIILNSKIISKLLDILDFFRFNQLFIQRNIILSILLEVEYYKDKSDIMKYPKLIKTITSDLLDDSNNDVTIISHEILYKILLLDFIFETKDYNHKSLMKLISAFIIFDKYKKSDNSDIDAKITNEFINYILGLKNEMKLYHYLKIIYLNADKLKKKLCNNDKFFEYITMKIEKINYNHCKYCAYNQILCFLINAEIPLNDYIFHHTPTSEFQSNPSSYFIKSIFSLCLSFSNENKLKFIKTKLDEIQFIQSIINSKHKESYGGGENEEDSHEGGKKSFENKYAKLVGYNKFIPKFDSLIEYIKFLFDNLKESNDSKLLNIISDSINFIMNFMKQIYLEKKNNLMHSNIRTNWSIITKEENINNMIKTSEKHSKENRIRKIYDDFIKELLCCKGMKTFYYIYLNINYKQALEDIKLFIEISKNDVYNPFYYYLLSKDLDYDFEFNSKNISTNDEINFDENLNQYIKCELLSSVAMELIKNKIIFDDSKDNILVQNNILLLIYIYHILVNKKIELNEEVEKIIILFLNFLFDNYFIKSKYVFNINLIINKNPTINSIPNKKFILEIIADILFTLYDSKNYDLKYQYLIKGIFINRKINLLKIDEQYFLENKNKDVCFKYFNQNYLHNICKGVEVPEILFTIYFLYYLCEKSNKYKNSINADNSEPIKLINEIISSIFVESIQLYNNYFQTQKIILVRKSLINMYPYKIYKHFMLFIADKYKEKGLTLDELFHHYDRLIVKKNINFERQSHFLNEELSLKNYSNNRGTKIEVIQETNTWNQPDCPKDLQIQRDNLNEIKGSTKRFAKSKSKFYHRQIEKMNSHNLENQLKESKRARSFGRKISIKIYTNNLTIRSSNNITQMLKKLSFEISDNESDKNDDNNNQDINIKFNDSFDDAENEKDAEQNGNYILNIKTMKENNENENKVEETDKIGTKKNRINSPKLGLISYNSNSLFEGDFNKNDIKNISQLHLSLQNRHEINNDEESDISEEESIVEEYNIKKKLKNINIPSRFYRNLFHLSDSKTMKVLFNPKEYYIWNEFTLILKKIIFHHKKFNVLSKIYNLTYKNLNLKKKKYYLKYPTKLKNFICDDYYRPFIKPDIYFFRHKLLPNTLTYIKSNIINTNFSDEDNLCKIKFGRVLPINYDFRPTKKIVCEIINNSGSIFGHIYFNHAFLLFISDGNNDPRNDTNKNKNDKQDDFYLYSYFAEDRLKNKKKYIIMYFSEIKEIFIRRFCLNYVGYEIFMKDNRSHLFNFFNKKNLKAFIHNMSEKLELSFKNKQNTNNPMIYSHNENILSVPILNFNVNNEINFSVINDPLTIFEKNGYKMKYQKGEINNFKYLLLINKFASRSYNDNNQYLIFPLLYMDIERKINRDLSKAICLNKNKDETNISGFIENFKSFGNHFNTHYSSCGYILYYLVRLIPFTFGHIKLQSGHFDSPERMFSSLENYLSAISNSDENRELCPELFFTYETFINLNHFDLGYIKSDNFLIDDFYSNDDNGGIIEFIINLRQKLEKANIIPWIDNIFGSNQTNEDDEVINIFPLSSYEQFNNFEEMKKKLEKKGMAIKEILREIKANIDLLSLGVTPVQLFKANHPLKNITSKRLFSFFDGGNNNINYYEKVIKSLSYKNLNYFINTYMIGKYQIFAIGNENNNFGMKLVIKSKNNINILKMFNNDYNKNTSIIKLELWKKEQVSIEPVSQRCCQLSPGIFCFCRYIDNVIQIKSEKQSFLYQYNSIITSVEFFSHSEIKNTTNNITSHNNEILFGDENGYLYLMQIEYEINNKKQTIQLSPDKIKIVKEIKVHNSFIQGILYVKRLNIIISYSEEGQITINNAFSFNIINIIELGEKYYIKDIKISSYDLLYVYCYNNINKRYYIKCYTLNGIKVTKLVTDKKINNFFITEEIIAVYENNVIEAYKLHDLHDHPVYVITPEEKDDKITNKEKIIVFCDLIIKDMKMIIIYQDQDIIIQDIFPLEK